MQRKPAAFLLLALAAVAAGGIWEFTGSAAQADDKKAAAPAPVPVTTVTAQAMDVPVYLYGLGTVQGLKVVQIKAQVTGILTSLPVKEGQEVAQGTVLATIDPAPYKAALDAAVAQRGEDSAQLQSAQLNLKRYSVLATRSDAPVQQVDDQRATVGKDEAAIALDNAKIETAQINLNYTIIKAPFAGRVSFYTQDVGNLVQADSTTGILSLQQDKPIAVVMTLPEDQLRLVRAAMERGPVRADAFDSSGDAILSTGVLMTPNNAIDTSTGTISLKSQFANADSHLWPGQFVNMRLQVDTLKAVVAIPSIAVQHGPQGQYVFRVQPDNTVQQVAISIGHQDSGLSVVTKGLAAKDVVVLSGQSRLTKGAHVTPKPAPADTTGVQTDKTLAAGTETAADTGNTGGAQ